MGIGFVLGYNRIFNQSYNLGPEVGLIWGTKRRMDVPPSFGHAYARRHAGYTIEERYLEIPIALRYGRVSYEDRGYLSVEYSLGYQLDVLLSSCYIPSSDTKRDLRQDIPDLPRLCRNLWIAGHLNFGICYLELKLKLPIDTLKKSRKQHVAFMQKCRKANTTAVEIGLGINILD